MRRSIAALGVATLIVILVAPAAAAPIQVHVRIEGKAETVFEGPILTDVHRVRDADDTQWRRCNGVTAINPSQAPAVVPTSASSDAMRIVGETFDGRWYGQWEDYFIERWGPDAQEVGSFKYWGVLVNNTFTDVGGCQYPLDGGDEALWVYDAFHDRPRLVLYPADYPGGALPGAATAALNQPFEVEVDTWGGYNEGAPPPAPTRSTVPYAGAEVAPVTTGAKGFQKVDVASDETVVTDANGKAIIVFTEPGWHRIKAADFAGATEIAVRSNRLDVCVPEPPASGCGALPADAALRTPPAPQPGEAEGAEPEGPKEDPPGAGPQGDSDEQPAPAADARQVRLGAPRLDRSRLDRGLVGVSWRVLDAGIGVGGWTVTSKRVGRKGGRWVNRASGGARSSATVRLPRGTTHDLRLTVVDVLGRGASAPLGRVRVPR